MIIAKSPFRISLIGGGSDLKSFYSKYPGAVISTSIDKFMYIMIHPYFHNKIRIKYSRLEDVENIEEISHNRVKECLRMLGIEKGVEIASIADIPAGTGLGSSSAFTVSLLHALYAYKKKYVTKERLANEASKIEIEHLKEPIGKQDQYASSYGGLNYIKFNQDGTVLVEPIVMESKKIKELEKRLLMFYVGGHRDASRILSGWNKNLRNEKKLENMKAMVDWADEMKSSLSSGRIKEVGEILHEGWILKRDLAPRITNSRLNMLYGKALLAGASGGKLLGAGSGGFFLFYCEPRFQNSLRNALELRELKFNFDTEGTRIIYANN